MQDSNNSQATIECGKYVRVVGYIKRQKDSNYINCVRIFPVNDGNELTAQIVAVVFTHRRVSLSGFGL